MLKNSVCRFCFKLFKCLKMSTSEQAKPEQKVEYAGVKLTLDNCLFPPEQLQVTPSEKEGLSTSVEEDLRYLGCEYIQIAGIMLKMPQVAMATAQVLFQRFFFIKSFVKNKMEEVAMACIWLASKVEEAPRRVRDVMNVFHYLRQRRLSPSSTPTPMLLDETYISSKNNVIKAERRLLKELGFCVHVKHPHKIIVVYLQVLEMEKNTNLVQTAWNYMNDSLRTTVFVKHTPETIACACIYLAARVLRIPLPNQPHWFYLFNATEEEIQKISLSILEVYQHKKPIHEELEKIVDARKKVLQEEKQKAKEANQAIAGLASAANSPSDSPFKESTNPSAEVKRVVDTTSISKERRSREQSYEHSHTRVKYKEYHKNRAISEGNSHKRRERERSRESHSKHKHRDRRHESSKSKRRDRERKREKHGHKRH